MDFVELLAPLVLLTNHHVLVETVNETGSHLLIAFRGELVRHFVTVKVAVERCLQSQAVEDVEFSLKCKICEVAAGKIQGVIAKMGCGASDVAITLACETVFLGPEDPVADICAAGGICKKRFFRYSRNFFS